MKKTIAILFICLMSVLSFGNISKAKVYVHKISEQIQSTANQADYSMAGNNYCVIYHDENFNY